jgi:hypothetical protein
VTIQINRTTAAVVATLLALTLVASYAAYSYGESTRKSDAAVKTLVLSRVSSAVGDRSKQATADQGAAVKTATKNAKRAQRKHDMKKLRTAVKKAEQKAYAAGQGAGFSSGSAAGYSSGHSNGVRDGIIEGSDELTCSDDSNVPLPACSY